MTYPDDVLKAAREAAAKVWDAQGCLSTATALRAGECDHFAEVQAACIAIMAERQASADRASKALNKVAGDKATLWDANHAVKQAILGQQEPSNA